MGHRNARLTPSGRRLLVERIEVHGWPVAHAADSMGVSRATAYKWVRRWRAEGEAGLEDRTSQPKRCPHRTGRRQVKRVLRMRRKGWGPHRIGAELGMARSTVYAILVREGQNRWCDFDKMTRRRIRRYERDRPGELIHVDVKKQGKVPPGGGWRKRGRAATAGQRARVGFEYLHVAVDDHTRLAYVEAHEDEQAETCAAFLTNAAAFYREHGIQKIEEVMTDRAFAYVKSRAFAGAIKALDAKHRKTRPYRPQTNGKAERFNRTLKEEWAYTRLYRSNSQRREALWDFVAFYNQQRPHTALDGKPPITRCQQP
jgi:transposase InsO family protein